MADENMISKADHEAAVAKAREEGRLEGAAGERSRIAAILALDEAKGREASAHHLALNTDLTADAAKGVLAGLQPAAAAPSPQEPVAAAPQRSADAPGGLVLDSPSPAASAGSKADDLWKKVIAGINGQNRAAY